jgi:zinc protease
VAPRATAPVVALQAWVGVGSADERPGEEGLAHVQEHMLFKGTRRRGVGQIARDVEARGGEVNAWTSFDHTVYHLVLPSRWLDDGLDILADALTGATFDGEELARELEVVVEEIRRAQDDPGRLLSRTLFAAAFQQHPYARPVIGTVESVRATTRDAVLAFYRAHYLPERMTVVVAGDADPARVEGAVGRLFPGSSTGAAPRTARPGEPRRPGSGTVVPHAVREALLGIALRATRLDDPITPALDALAVVLGQGDSSRLLLDVRRDRRLASEVWAYAYTPADPGLFVVGAALPEEALPECARALGGHLARLAAEPVTPAELASAKALLDAGAVHQIETVEGLARRLGQHATMADDAAYGERHAAAVAALRPEDLVEAARRVLALDEAVVAAVVPRGSAAEAMSGADLFELVQEGARSALRGGRSRSAPLPAPAAAPRRLPALQGGRRDRADDGALGVHTLSSGVTLLVKPERAVPLAALRAVWRGGLRVETEQDNGVSQLLARLLTKGTRRRGAAEIARAVDAMAGALGGQAGRGTLGLHAELLARHLTAGFELFAECLAEPAFLPEEVDRERALQVEEIRSRDDSPGAVAFELFQATLYREHPWRLGRLGTEETVARLGAQALAEHLATRYPRSRLTVAVVGDVDREAVLELAENLLGGHVPAAWDEPPPRPEHAPDGRREARRALDKEQVHLVHGFLGLTVDDPQRDALEVLAAALSGQAGRLFLELRDRRALAYAVSALNAEGLDPGFFAVHLATSPDKLGAARAALEAELSRVVEEGLTEEELERAARHLVGVHDIGLQRVAARAAVLAFDTACGLGPDHHLRYAERIGAVTVADVRAVARRVVREEQAVVAMVGPGV